MTSFRISNIPKELDEDDLGELLGGDSEVASFAPATNAIDAPRKRVALVSFGKVPEGFEQTPCPSIKIPKEILKKAGIKGKRVDLQVDCGFLGLTPLNWEKGEIVMDVVAVTGLGGHAFGSWKAKKADYMWLCDSLPEDVSGLRVMTYGFSSGLVGSTSFAGIGTYAQELLEELKGARDHDAIKQRPLVFIAHSLGGLVVKQLLVEAARGDDRSQAVFNSTLGLLSYGVPNRGLSVESLVPMVHGQPNEDLVRALKPESHFLEMLHRDFCTHFRFRDSKIVSFYENLLSPTAEKQSDGSWKMTGKPQVLVTRSSATGSRPEEPAYHDLPIHATHSEMVKFSSEVDREYTIARDKIKQFRDEAPIIISKRFHSGVPLGFSITEEEHLLQNKSGWSSLHLAAHKGSLEVVEKLLEDGADIEKKGNKNETALSVAVAAGNRPVVKLLLDKGANIHAKNFTGSTALYYASESGQEAIVELLLDRGADIKVIIRGQWTCLHRAAGVGKERTVRLLLDRGAGMEATNSDLYTPLHSAADCGFDRCVKLLLSRGANIEASATDGRRAIHLAAAKGNEAIVRELLKRGANIEAKTVDGRTAMYVAAAAGHRSVVAVLMHEGFAMPDSPTNTLWTPLHVAAHNGYDGVIKELIAGKANLEVKTDDQRTPLHAAATEGREEVVRLLLDHKADIEAKNQYWATPLHFAAKNAHEPVVQLLLDRGAEVDSKMNNRETPLIEATRAGNEVMVRILLDHGANIDAKCETYRPLLTATGSPQGLLMNTGENMAPIHIACMIGKEALAKLLLERGASIESICDTYTPLHIAAGNGNDPIVRLLLSHKANIDSRAHWQQRPLHLAASQGRHKTVIILLDHGADIEAKVTSLWTPLHMGAKFGHIDVVRVLLERGANVRAADRLWREPLRLAKSEGHVEVAKLLQEYGAWGWW